MSRTAVSPPTSPPHSPSLLGGPSSSIQPRHVQHRRGSTSAADPWGNHLQLNMNPSRTSTCKLTIVRVNPTPPIQLDEQPPSPQHRRHVGFGAHSQNSHRRLGSHGTGKGENTRMSFASSSFAPPGSSSGPGQRSGSPTHGHGHSLYRRRSAPKPRLSADQLVSLAQQSCNPQSAPASPRTPGGSLSGTSGSGRNSFTAIPDDVFLPFVDRAEEVRALFTSPQPGGRLLALLAQTFPLTSNSAPVIDGSVLGTDPRQWSFAQLEHWIKQVDRDVAPDEVWVGLIRRCVLYRSELIWERIKGALGAPPELDPDGFEMDPYTVDVPLIFKNLKLGHSSDPGTRLTESPVQDFNAEPHPTPDNVSESNVSVLTGGSPDISTLSIEPVLVTTSPAAEHDHPPTRPGGHRMHDISEDREESDGNEDEAMPSAKPISSSKPQREIIQGLCISTGPALPGLFATDPSQIVPTPLSRTLSASSITQQLQSTQVASSPPKRRSWSYAGSSTSSEAYDMAGERGPGNPLFPTNFARLALGPTLTAKYVFLLSLSFHIFSSRAMTVAIG
jgi:hypothetical protein